MIRFSEVDHQFAPLARKYLISRKHFRLAGGINDCRRYPRGSPIASLVVKIRRKSLPHFQ
jgi:hypothetical protein